MSKYDRKYKYRELHERQNSLAEEMEISENMTTGWKLFKTKWTFKQGEQECRLQQRQRADKMLKRSEKYYQVCQTKWRMRFTKAFCKEDMELSGLWFHPCAASIICTGGYNGENVCVRSKNILNAPAKDITYAAIYAVADFDLRRHYSWSVWRGVHDIPVAEATVISTSH